MSFFFLLAGLVLDTAHAASIDTWGNGGAGVSQMWSTIRGTLYTNTDPVNALSTATVGFVFPLIGGVAVLAVLYAGIKMISGQGKEESFSKAKEIIYYALGGVLLAMLATAIVGYFGTVFFPTLFQ